MKDGNCPYCHEHAHTMECKPMLYRKIEQLTRELAEAVAALQTWTTGDITELQREWYGQRALLRECRVLVESHAHEEAVQHAAGERRSARMPWTALLAKMDAALARMQVTNLPTQEPQL